jgi:DNA repair protein RadD
MKSVEPQCLVLPTGSGKSIIVSMLAKKFTELSGGKKILCLAPSESLVTQNHEKYTGYGFDASIFCASANRKSLRHGVVFGSPLSILNSIERVKQDGYAAIIIDETDLITDTVKQVVYELKEFNPNLRIVGLTATPYRMKTGYIYESHYKNGFVEETIEPYFKQCTYEISAKELIEQGYLTKPLLGKTALKYETDGLVMSKSGNWTNDSLDKAFNGRGRLTSQIVADFIEVTKPYRGVMIFAATIEHGNEIMESLPKELSGFVHSKNKESKKILKLFKQQAIRYIVNVGVLTVGVDVPHADVIVMMRLTESARLYQQIIGRVLRLFPDKPHSLVLDYADNNINHFPHGDVFSPVIRVSKKGESERIEATCPECNHVNDFAERPNEAGYEIDEQGYWIWTDTKDRVKNADSIEIPGHLGRRCMGIIKKIHRCTYMWSYKECPECEHQNDIAARYCSKCKHELIDPNEKLKLESAQKEAGKLVEPVYSVELGERTATNGTTKLKEITITTTTMKRIKLFLFMGNEKQRDKFRLCREMQGKECNVEFTLKGKYYEFMGFNNENLW